MGLELNWALQLDALFHTSCLVVVGGFLFLFPLKGISSKPEAIYFFIWQTWEIFLFLQNFFCASCWAILIYNGKSKIHEKSPWFNNTLTLAFPRRFYCWNPVYLGNNLFHEVILQQMRFETSHVFLSQPRNAFPPSRNLPQPLHCTVPLAPALRLRLWSVHTGGSQYGHAALWLFVSYGSFLTDKNVFQVLFKV